MKKQDKVKKIHKILDELYPKPQKPLNHKDAYTLLIAVLLFINFEKIGVKTM